MRKLIVTAAAVLAAVLMSAPASAQSADSIYVTPASGSYPVGTSFTVSVRENTSTQVNAVQADLSYSSNIQFVSIDASGSAFGIDASSTGGGGVVSMSRGTIVPVSGDKLVAKVTFKVVSGGTATISMQDSSVVLSSSTNTDVIKSRKGSSFDAQQGGTAPNPTPTPVVTTPEPSPAGSSGSNSSGGGLARGSLPVNTIAPLGSGQSSAMPGDSVVELEAPATIVTTPDSNRKVMKVEYLLNGKLLATDDSPPYSHTLDTTKYRNGEYTFTTRTYYQDGAPDISNSTIVVKNKLTPYQLWLNLVHYAWLIVIVLVIIAEVLYLKFFRRKRHQRPPSGPMPGAGRFGGPPAGGPGSGAGPGPGFGQPGAPRPPAMTTQSLVASSVPQPQQVGSVPSAQMTAQATAQPAPGAAGQATATAPQPAASAPAATSSQQQGQNV